MLIFTSYVKFRKANSDFQSVEKQNYSLNVELKYQRDRYKGILFWMPYIKTARISNSCTAAKQTSFSQTRLQEGIAWNATIDRGTRNWFITIYDNFPARKENFSHNFKVTTTVSSSKALICRFSPITKLGNLQWKYLPSNHAPAPDKQLSQLRNWSAS